MESAKSNLESAGKSAEKPLSQFRNLDSIVDRRSPGEVQFGNSESAEPNRVPLNRYQELEQQIRNAPAVPDPYIELANAYRADGRLKDAKRIVDRGVHHNEECYPLLDLQEDLALEYAHMAVTQAKSQHARHKNELTEKTLHDKELDLANLRIKVCSSRLARNPNDHEFWIPWAIALRQLGRDEEAIEKLKTASKIEGIRCRALLQLGMCYQRAGSVLEALAAYRRAAFFRVPMPPLDVRKRAMELALDLAEQAALLDSALAYGELLVPLCEEKELTLLKARLETLRKKFKKQIQGD